MTDIAATRSLRRAEHPDPVDIHVGARLRLRRNMIGMSQDQLGRASGLTFQQIQKYERGTNRMGASRLHQLAKLLGVSVAYFFEDMAPEISLLEPGSGFSDTAQAGLEGMPAAAPPENELLQRRETLELIRAYYRIADPKQRRKFYELIKSMSEQVA